MNGNPDMSETYLQGILDSLADTVIVITGPDCIIEYQNNVLENVFGFTRAETLTKSMKLLFVDEQDYDDLRGKINGLRGTFTSSYTLAVKSGSKIIAEICCHAMAGETDNAGRIVVRIRDISALVNARNAKERKELQSIQMHKMEAIGRFTSGLAHDFNNLLTGIQGFSKLSLRQVKDGDPLKEDLEEIYKAAEHTGILTRQLLFFSRKQPMKSKNFPITQTISNMSHIIRWLVGENIKVTTEFTPGSGLIFGDEIQIEQVIINMLLNSRDAMPHGGLVLIKVKNVNTNDASPGASPEAKKGKFVCVTIKDAGTGMDKETLSHIFEPFFTTKEFKKGTGLGLFVAYGIVKQHEGWIDYSSSPGEGTEFKIYLPAGTNDNDALADEPRAVLTDYHGNGERVLVVEEDNSVRKFACQTLSTFGYKVSEAETGQDAGEMFKREKGDFSLLLVDVVLSDMTGLELIDALKRENADLKILITNGFTDNKKEVQAITSKGYKFMQKPYSVEDLLHFVKGAITKNA